MLKQLSIKVGEDFLAQIDACVEADPLIDTRTEWIKQALRDRVIARKTQELIAYAAKHKRSGTALTIAERNELFDELVKRTRPGS